jgi:hypothetical protein
MSRAESGRGEHRPYPHERAFSTDQRYRRKPSQKHAQRVLAYRVPLEDIRLDRRRAGRSGRVACLIVAEPVKEKNGLQIALIRIMESIGILNRRQAAFLDDLYGEKGSANRVGLDALEIRGQCAMIIAAVILQLSQVERHAIWVRYAKGTERKNGVIFMSKKLRAVVSVNQNAVRYLVAGQSLLSEERDPEKTFKYICEQTGVPIRTLERAAMIVRKQLAAHQNAPYDKLTPMFERDGLVNARD